MPRNTTHLFALLIYVCIFLTGCGDSSSIGEQTDGESSVEQEILDNALSYTVNEIEVAMEKVVSGKFEGNENDASVSFENAKLILTSQTQLTIPALPVAHLSDLSDVISDLNTTINCFESGTADYQGKITNKSNYSLTITYNMCQARFGEELNGNLIYILAESQSESIRQSFLNNIRWQVDGIEYSLHGKLISKEALDLTEGTRNVHNHKDILIEGMEKIIRFNSTTEDKTSNNERQINYSGYLMHEEAGKLEFSAGGDNLYPSLNLGQLKLFKDQNMILSMEEEFILLKQKDNNSGVYTSGQYFPNLASMLMTDSLNLLNLNELTEAPIFKEEYYLCEIHR